MPDNSTRIANVTNYGNGGYGGFGYVVSHRGDGTTGIAADDSPLGFAFTGTFQRVFEGRHHAIFRFTQSYPRYSSTTASPPNTLYNVPVTIDWIFSTGRDNPVWTVTWDLSGVPVNSLNDDSRAPYGEFNIDGVGAQDISGVAWGDRYKFTSTLAPVTLNSTWTWNVANTVPYVKLWIDSTNASMGCVQTQRMSNQDAGGGRNPFYHDLTVYWGKTSADGNAGGAYKMPYQGDWPYQANSFSIGPALSNNNARLTWGTQYGFLGQQNYTVNDGVVATAPGWPKKSYATYVVLGTNVPDAVGAQVSNVEAINSVTLSATVGSVTTSGPAGVNRADTVTYAPAGHNHIYDSLDFNASSNQLDANVNVGSGTLKVPLFIIHSYSGADPVVKLGGVTLTADADYFASLRPSVSELWLTLNRNLTGSTNHLEINTSGAARPTIGASGPTTFCAGGSVTLTASTPAGAGISYLWSPGGATTRAIVVTTSGSYTVTVTTNGVPSTSDPTVVTVNPIPTTPVITAPTKTRAGLAGVIASVVSHAGATYAWSITNGTITAGQGSNQITFTVGNVGTVALGVIETIASCNSAQASLAIPVSLARGDFDLNGKSDIVLRNYSTGQTAAWLMNGTTLAGVADFPGLTNLNYHVVATADFDKDGKNDLLWRNFATGQTAVWVMNKTAFHHTVDLPGLANTAYFIEGAADFNNDGSFDIIWRNYSTGQDALWLMNGTSFGSTVDLPALPNLNYHMEGSGDFNGDTKPDIVWRNYATGQDALWLMNGTSFGSIVDLPALTNLNYRIEGIADFNGDGKTDILWRNYSTGQNAMWLMNGTAVSQVVDLPVLTNVNYEINGPR